MDKLTGIGQKGYSCTKQCQEVLINIVDSISTLKANGTRQRYCGRRHNKRYDSTGLENSAVASLGPDRVNSLHLSQWKKSVLCSSCDGVPLKFKKEKARAFNVLAQKI
jgi:hypothetical protein